MALLAQGTELLRNNSIVESMGRGPAGFETDSAPQPTHGVVLRAWCLLEVCVVLVCFM